MQQRELAGTVSAFAAFLLWGLLPVYWKWVDTVPAAEILAHRVIWALFLMAAVVAIAQRNELMSSLRDLRAVLIAAGAGILVGGNWFIYTYAVVADRIVEASLGYYINPLVSVLLGVVVLRESLSRAQIVAVALAFAGVLVLAISYGRVPWISLGLAFSFATYGLVKKTGRLNSTVGLLVELTVLTPIALVYLGARHLAGAGAFAAGVPATTWLLVGAGLVTVVPLLLFGAGARRIPLSRVGFLQYLAPSLMLLIGTVFYGEPFTGAHAVSFGLIWTALGIYTVAMIRRARMAPRSPGASQTLRAPLSEPTEV